MASLFQGVRPSRLRLGFASCPICLELAGPKTGGTSWDYTPEAHFRRAPMLCATCWMNYIHRFQRRVSRGGKLWGFPKSKKARLKWMDADFNEWLAVELDEYSRQ